MGLEDENSTYYDVLEVKPDATPEEIREAYLRTKSAYSRDSVALYSLINAEETKEMLQKIEQAYSVLSHAQKRREYDSSHGFIDPGEDFFHHPYGRATAPPRKIISIDRVPPMESPLSDEGESLLVPPTTDFSAPSQPSANQIPLEPPTDIFQPAPEERRDPLPERRQAYRPAPQPAPRQPAPRQPAPSEPGYSQEGPLSPELEREILQQTEWRGDFLRRVREALRFSIEEVSANTKVSKNYLLAIEDEEFTKLPAAVYVRGFVIQVARLLKLPPDQVAAAYMERFKKSRT